MNNLKWQVLNKKSFQNHNKNPFYIFVKILIWDDSMTYVADLVKNKYNIIR